MANNMKLEEAIAHLDESLNDQNHDWGCEECKQEHEQLREWLIELKERRAADVKPAVRSYWEKEPDGGYVCHECRQRPLLDGSEADALSDYCPSCGAIMIKEQQEWPETTSTSLYASASTWQNWPTPTESRTTTQIS